MTNRILKKNLILNVDSYKFGQSVLYPKGTEGMHSYIEARKPDEMMVPFGLQMWIKKNLLTPITKQDIEEYIEFTRLRGEPCHPELFQYVIDTYGGYLPVTIYGQPEGTPVKSQTALVTSECIDRKLFWLPAYLETNLLRGVWYPTTIATNDRKNYLALKTFYDAYADTNDLLPFSLHDFGARSTTSEEQAEIGGAAHMIYFQGSDTVEGVRAANFYYNTLMSGFSVIATEHSIQCSYGMDNQEDYIRAVLDTYAKPGAIVSIVLDGYDIFRDTLLLCTVFHDQIVASGAKIVLRPDSGNFMKIIPLLLEIMEKYFGFTVNSKGLKLINNVGLIQGDGINHTSMIEIEQMVHNLGYAPGTVVYGSGGKLLNDAERDDYGVAQKASAIFRDGLWHDIFKAPITDPGKRSKAGRQTLPEMVKYYDVQNKQGILYVDENMDTIRARALS